MKNRVFQIIFWSVFYLPFLSAQTNKRAGMWYFGRNAGINFANQTAVALTDGALNTWEGCATMSDLNGKLLFYTDGRSIWNSNHQLIPNATNLGGHNSTTQSATILPFPGHPNIYYIFSVAESSTIGV